jgi:CheY-like chemotaxis protein
MHNRHTILIVEDDPDLAMVLSILLEQEQQAQILHACNAQEAIRLLQEYQPDLISVDLNLDQENGFTVIDWLHKAKRSQPTPILVYSSQDVSESERKWLEHRSAHILIKGRSTPTEFLQKVSMLLHQPCLVI